MPQRIDGHLGRSIQVVHLHSWQTDSQLPMQLRAERFAATEQVRQVLAARKVRLLQQHAQQCRHYLQHADLLLYQEVHQRATLLVQPPDAPR